MAKFGFLNLKQGKWENDQLLPQKWIKEYTQEHVKTYIKDTVMDINGGLQK